MFSKLIYTDEGAGVLESYKRMAREEVTDEFINKILRRCLPLRSLPDYIVSALTVDYLKEAK